MSMDTTENVLIEYQARIASLEIEKKILEIQYEKQLKLTNAINVINKHISRATTPDTLINTVLEEFLDIFSCDRAILLSPCDPLANFYRIHSQSTRLQWPGSEVKVKIPMDAPTADIFVKVINAPGAIFFDSQVNCSLGNQEKYKRLNIRALMKIKIKPKVGETWLIGIHHCEQSVVFNEADIELFETLAELISVGIANLLNLRREKTLFNNSEICILNEDLSEIYIALNVLRKNGILDLAKYMDENPNFVWNMVKLTRVIDVNKASMQLFGAKSKTQLKESIANTFTATSITIFSEALCSIFDKKNVFKREVDFKTVDGRVVNTIITFKIPNTEAGFFCVPISIIDITDTKQAQREIVKRNDRIRLLLDSTAEAIYGIDMYGNCTLVNNACLKMLGYTKKSELIGKNLCSLVHQCTSLNQDDCEKRFCPLYRVIEQKITMNLEHKRLWRKDGTSFPITCWSSPIIEEDEVVGAVVTFLDITEKLTDKATIKANQIKIQNTMEGTILAISRAIEARDPYTAGHQKNVADLSLAIAIEMGLSDAIAKGIYLGASIHDIGKIQIPAEMLCKPSRLTELEYQLIQLHSQAGYEIVKGVEFPWPIANILYQHHERMDGSGYPLGLKGDQICIEARIVAVADVVEAMNSHRPYRPGLGIDKALNEIKVNRGSLYDKNVVDTCLKVFLINKFNFEAK